MQPNLIRSTLAFLLLTLTLMPARAADYFWVGGTGNWSDYGNHWATTSGGTIFHAAIPSINDDVYFDANSFTAAGQSVTFDNTFIYCLNMNFTGVQFIPSVNGLLSKLNVYGSLTLVPGMNWSVKRTDFAGTGSGLTLTTAGLPFDTLYFTGSGSYALMDALNCKSVFIQNGSFGTNNNSITADYFTAGITGATVSVDLGTSLITCHNLFRASDGFLTLTSSQSDLLLTNTYPPYNSTVLVWLLDNKQFNHINCDVNTEIIGSFTCQQLTAQKSFYNNGSFYTSSATVALFHSGARLSATFNVDSLTMLTPGSMLRLKQLNIGMHFEAVGTCALPINIQADDFLPSSTISMSSGTMNLEYCILTSVNATGGATFVANNSFDGGNNSGWTINGPPARILYWIGGNGNWNDDMHWATTSGGAGGNCIPSAIDDVIFDANSFTQTGDSVKLTGVQATCRNMDWSQVINNPRLVQTAQSGLNLTGSLTLSANMIPEFSTFGFVGSLTGNTIFTAGQNIYRLFFDGTGSWSLSDDLTGGSIQVYRGSFNSNSHNINLENFSANGINNAINVDFGNSTINISENYMAFSPQLSISSANANLVFSGTVSTLYCQINDVATFDSVTVNHYTYFYGTLTCNTFTSTSGVRLNNIITGNAYFHRSFTGLNLSADSMTLFTDVTGISFDSLIIGSAFISSPDCYRPLQLNSYSPGAAQSVFIKTSGTVNLNYTYIARVNAQGGAVFNANNCWDIGGNSGWNFTTPPARDLYWVGGGGEWDDPAHWSLASNGTPGECPPTLTDNINFDGSSIGSPGQTVNIGTELNVYCNNLSFSGIPAGTVLMSGTNSPIYVNGSVALVPELDPWALNLNMISGNAGNTIHSGNNNIYGLTLSGSGSLSLASDIQCGNFFPKNGTFNTNNFNITTGGINTSGTVVLNLGNSTIYVQGLYASSPGTIFNAAGANIVMQSSVLSFNVNNPVFNSVTFTGNANTNGHFTCNYLVANGEFVNINSQITAGHALFKDKVTLSQTFNADTVVFDNPGKLVRLQQMNISDVFSTNGTAGFPVQIEGYNGTGTINKSSGLVCVDHVLLKDIAASGGAQFFAGGSSVDLGGNSGWVFGPCSPQTDVWPGDANYDLTADNFDILNIGLAYGYTGPVRPGASLSWVAQPSPDWSFQFANFANLKHADTDGNGMVNDDDTLAVALNYGLTHPFRLVPVPSSVAPVPELFLVANPDTVQLSDTVQVEVHLGTTTLPVDSIYGIAFTVNFDTALVETNYLAVDFSSCWMGVPQSNLIVFNKDLLSDGRVEMAIVRTDQQNTNGFGKLAQIGVVVVDNVGAKISMPVWIDDIKAITASEYLLAIATMGDSVVIDTTGTVGIHHPNQELFNVMVYPNPSGPVLNVVSSEVLSGYEVIDLQGRTVVAGTIKDRKVAINTGILNRGFYFLKLWSDKGLVVRKIELTGLR